MCTDRRCWLNNVQMVRESKLFQIWSNLLLPLNEGDKDYLFIMFYSNKLHNGKVNADDI